MGGNGKFVQSPDYVCLCIQFVMNNQRMLRLVYRKSALPFIQKVEISIEALIACR